MSRTTTIIGAAICGALLVLLAQTTAEAATKRATRSTRNSAPVHATKLHYPLEYDEDTDYVGGDGTRIAVAKWIQAHADPRSAPKRLAGAEHPGFGWLARLEESDGWWAVGVKSQALLARPG